jgi:hypothetical protein
VKISYRNSVFFLGISIFFGIFGITNIACGSVSVFKNIRFRFGFSVIDSSLSLQGITTYVCQFSSEAVAITVSRK